MASLNNVMKLATVRLLSYLSHTHFIMLVFFRKLYTSLNYLLPIFQCSFLSCNHVGHKSCTLVQNGLCHFFLLNFVSFHLLCLFWGKLYRAVTSCDISLLLRDIQHVCPMSKVNHQNHSFILQDLQPQFPGTWLFFFDRGYCCTKVQKYILRPF